MNLSDLSVNTRITSADFFIILQEWHIGITTGGENGSPTESKVVPISTVLSPAVDISVLKLNLAVRFSKRTKKTFNEWSRLLGVIILSADPRRKL
jgi:hypothetical protein